MLKIPSARLTEFKKIYDNHIMDTAACYIFMHHIKLITKRPKLISRDDFFEYFNMFSDIELKTAPMDTFVEVPYDENKEMSEEEAQKELDDMMNGNMHIVEINRVCPEFVKIQGRITEDEIRKNFPEDHRIIGLLNNEANDKEQVIDQFTVDCFIHWSIEEYLKNISKIRVAMISNATPLIEYMVDNITLKDLKDYLSTTKRINEEKYADKKEDLFFEPDLNYCDKFYKEHNAESIKHFDVINLMKRLVSNEVLKTDIYIIIAIYMILTYCKVPISDTNKGMDEKCVNYVRDVISQL